MIPRVRRWRVRVPSQGRTFYIDAPTKRLVQIIVRMDLPSTWGERLVISPMRPTVAKRAPHLSGC